MQALVEQEANDSVMRERLMPPVWIDPPGQDITDRDLQGIYDKPEIAAEESALQVVSGAGHGRMVGVTISGQ
jgi:hypothetical protein